MSNKRSFHLYNGDKLIGKFELLDTKDKYTVQLIDGLETLDIPIDFMPEYFQGQRFFKNKEVFEWIRDRVIPSGRQNIAEILRKVGVEEYDELAIFLYANGKCCMDSFRIEEIT